MTFNPHTDADRAEMLKTIGVDAIEDLFAPIPESVRFPKLDLLNSVIEGFRNPPSSPDECIFSRTTINYTADLKSRIAPCQFGGNPDCSQCGCIASAGLKALGSHKLFGAVEVNTIFRASTKVGSLARAATRSS